MLNLLDLNSNQINDKAIKYIASIINNTTVKYNNYSIDFSFLSFSSFRLVFINTRFTKKSTG